MKAYNEFTLDILLRNFLVKIEEVPGLFADFAPMALSDLLQQQLDAYLTLALEISTDKARSEFTMPLSSARYCAISRNESVCFPGWNSM